MIVKKEKYNKVIFEIFNDVIIFISVFYCCFVYNYLSKVL